MSVRTRKLIGTVALLLFLSAYSLLVMALSASRVTEAPVWMQTLFFLVAGLAWVPPAGLLVRWMQKP